MAAPDHTSTGGPPLGGNIHVPVSTEGEARAIMSDGPRIAPPAGITYDAKAACFRNQRGARMSVTFDVRWFKRAGEFPIYEPVKEDATAPGSLGDLDDRQQAMVETLMGVPVTDLAAAHARDLAAATKALHGVETAVHDSVDHGEAREYEAAKARELADAGEPERAAAVDHEIRRERIISDARKAELDRVGQAMDAIGDGWQDGDEGRPVPAPKDFNPKTAAGRSKPAMEFVPPVALMHLAEVMRGGSRKYGAFNWRQDKVSETTYYSAAHRHLAMWFDGEDTDRESGQMHLAHVMACCAILLDADSVGMLHRDRPEPGNATGVVAALTTLRQALDKE